MLNNNSRRLLSFRTLEEVYYMVMGIQYPLTPLLITEHQWQITGIVTPVIIFTLLRREVVNHWFSSWTASRTNHVPRARSGQPRTHAYRGRFLLSRCIRQISRHITSAYAQPQALPPQHPSSGTKSQSSLSLNRTLDSY